MALMPLGLSFRIHLNNGIALGTWVQVITYWHHLQSFRPSIMAAFFTLEDMVWSY